jgi:tetratricopeptide (TPR) repeat protein
MDRHEPIAISVFVSSPADVMPERMRLQAAAARVNARFAGRVRFDLYRWENGQYFTASETIQAQIPDTSTFQLVIGILGHRIGTQLPVTVQGPAGSELSGTAFELLTAIEASRRLRKPDVYVFRKRSCQVLPIEAAARAEALTQYEKLECFWSQYFRGPAGAFLAGQEDYKDVEDFERKIEGLLLFWLERNDLLTDTVAWPVERRGSPFLGLKAFGPEHAAIFFGRGAAVRASLSAMIDGWQRRAPFLLLLGPSGSGKSSLAAAGVLPNLIAPGVIADIDAWRVARIRPGIAGPLASFAVSLFPSEGQDVTGALPELARTSYPDACTLATHLAHGSPAPILHAMRLAAEDLTAREGFARAARLGLIVLVDQLEEMLDHPEVNRLAELLGELIQSRSVFGVATLRADSYGRLIAIPAWQMLKQQGAVIDVLPPDRGALAEMVQSPAAAAGLAFEARLARDPGSGQTRYETLDALILREAGDADALALVQFTLAGLLEHALAANPASRVLTFASYEAVGGLMRSVANAAEIAINAVRQRHGPSAVDGALDNLIAALVRTQLAGDGSERWVAIETERAALDRDQVLSDIVTALVSARILVATTSASATPTLRLAHEAALRTWPAAVAALNRLHDKLALRERITRRYVEWDRAGRTHDLLLPAAQVASAALLAQDPQRLLAPDLIAYVSRSRRYRLRKRTLVAVVTVLLIGLTVAVPGSLWLAEMRRRQGETFRQAATALGRAIVRQPIAADEEPQRRIALLQPIRSVLDLVHDRSGGEPILDEARLQILQDQFAAKRSLDDAEGAAEVLKAQDAILAHRSTDTMAPQRWRSYAAMVLVNHGDLDRHLGRRPEATARYAAALELLAAHPPTAADGQRALATTLERVSWSAREANDLQACRIRLVDALSLRRAVLDAEPTDANRRDLGITLFSLAQVDFAAGDQAAAARAADEAVTIRRGLANRPAAFEARFELAWALAVAASARYAEQEPGAQADAIRREGASLAQQLAAEKEGLPELGKLLQIFEMLADGR